ncbi:glycosyltransferase family 4 protein [Citrifermentans pelophilum]|uniref:glycosyltransferase family 4 protein n=1 Tax=Geoanaerobacter pelophilus TaxID=60036 RepID=UPI001BDA03D0
MNIVEGAHYKNVRIENIHLYLWSIQYFARRFKLIKKHPVDHFFRHRGPNFNGVDLYHFFNTVSFTARPWVSTFESLIPRYSELMVDTKDGGISFPRTGNLERAMKAIASDNCKKIIALSDCTKMMQEKLIRLFPEYEGRIKDKLCTLHPPQRLFIGSFAEKGIGTDSVIRFMFVGRDFVTKGGLEILATFKTLVEEHRLPIKLVVVSSLGAEGYARHATDNELEAARRTLNESEWIEYYESLPNYDVIKLMIGSHVGLLPTWADTYGYSALEFQSAGCPVISTDIRALPEINNDEVGYLIKVPKKDYGEGLYKTESDRLFMAETIKKGLVSAVLSIFADLSQIETKSNLSIRNIVRNHDPVDYANRLKQIYQEALTNRC